MLYYNKLYWKKGMRRKEHLVSPKVLDARDFEFPVSSLLHFLKYGDDISYVTEDYPYLKKNSDAYVYENEYDVENPLGKRTKNTSFILQKYLQESIKRTKSMLIVKPNQKVHLKDKVLKIINYNSLLVKYKYMNHVFKDYYRFRNIYSVLFENIGKSDRQEFIMIDLPLDLMDRLLLERITINTTSDQIKANHLKELPDYKNLLLYELWKVLTPETRDFSIFSKIPRTSEEKVNLLFNLDNKLVMFNYRIFINSIVEYNAGENLIKPMKANVFRKVFYNTLLNVYITPAMTDSELDEHEKNLDTVPEEPQEETRSNDEDEYNQLEEEYQDDIREYDDLGESLKEDDEIAFDDDDDDGTMTYLGLTKSGGVNKNAKVVTSKIKEDIKKDTGDKPDKELLRAIATYSKVSEDPMVAKLEQDMIDAEDAIEADLDKILKEEQTPEMVTQKLDKLIDDVKKNDLDPTQKNVNIKHLKTFKDTVERQYKSKDPFGTNKTIREILDTSKDDSKIEDDKGNKITPNKVVFKEDFNSDIINNINRKYIKNQYKKDMVRVMYSFQNSGYIVENYEVETTEDIMGGMETHKLTLKTLDNKTHNISFKIPVVDENGVMKISGNDYVMRKQKNTTVISKIAHNKVKIASYNGTMFVDKAHYKKDDLGYYFMNRLSSLYGIGVISNLILRKVKLENKKTPQHFACFARYTLSFTFKELNFNFSNPKVVDGKVEVGNAGKKTLYMDFDNNILLGESNLGTIPDMLEMNMTKAPIEFAVITVKGTTLPVVILLCYYYGLENLLKIVGIEYQKVDSHRYKQGYYSIAFKNKTLVLKRDNGIGDMLFGGLSSIAGHLISVNLEHLNSKNSITVLFTKLEFRPSQWTEVKILETTFVDPITESVCKELGYPTTFKGLLIKACELLLDDTYVNQSNMANMRLLGYERIAGLVYKELHTAIKNYEVKSMYTKATINVNPYDVLRKINEDSTNVLVDDLNPIAAMKQTEDVSLLGAFGFGKDSLAKDSRVFDESEVGVMSEATKDSGDVGITAYLTASPNITNTRGITKEFDNKKDGHAKLFSTSALLAPFSMNDGPQRLNFISIMNAHIIPISNMRVPYIRTGYEAIIPIRATNKYVQTAEADGKVLKVDNKSVTVEYTGGKKKTYYIRDWTTKEESGACYTHHMKANVKVGDKFIKDDTLIYATSFFEPDIFNPKRVIYKQGDLLTVALTEDLDTFEDSATISASVYQRMSTEVTKTRSIVVNKDDVIVNLVKVGQDVEPSSVLFTAVDADVAGGKELDERTLAVLKQLKSVSPKAKVKGTIYKIELRYNCDPTTAGPEMQKLIAWSDKNLKELYGHPGKVTMGYSIAGKSLLNDQVEIKIYIKSGVDMSSGDKAILGNQLKFTVGDVYYNTLHAEDGTPIDATFSYRSISARIVNSPILMGTTGMVLEQLTKKALETYFGKK